MDIICQRVLWLESIRMEEGTWNSLFKEGQDCRTVQGYGAREGGRGGLLDIRTAHHLWAYHKNLYPRMYKEHVPGILIGAQSFQKTQAFF